MNETESPAEIAADISRKRYRILAAIRNRGGETKSSEITSATGLGSSLANYHYRALIDAGLIEKTGEGDASKGLPREGYSYRITDRGREVASIAQEEYDLDALDEGAVRRRFDRLEDRLGSLEQQMKGRAAADGGGPGGGEGGGGGGGGGEVVERAAALEERIGEVEEVQRELIGDMRKLVEFLEETRAEVGLGGLWDDADGGAGGLNE